MSSATLNIRVSPRRMLSKADAALYCLMSTKRFEAECPCRPVERPGGTKAWDMHDLDRWLDGLKGGAGATHEEYLERLE
jgi:hypothetical protein